MNDNKTRKVLAGNIKKLMAERKWSLRELARRTGDPLMTLQGITSGDHLARAGILVRIANAFEVSVEILFAEENLQKAS